MGKKNYINKSRRKLRPWIRIVLFLVISFFLFQSISFIAQGLNINKENKKIYSYNIKQDLNYNVDLYKNNLYESENIEMDQTYVSNLVKSINFNFDYDFQQQINTVVNYEYEIDATIYGEYTLPDEDEKSELWTKKYTILKKQYKQTNKEKFSVNEKTNIDFDYYNNVVNQYRNEIKLPITAYLNVEFRLKISTMVNGKFVNDTKKMIAKIPLNQQAFKITTNYDKKIEKNVNKYDKKELGIDYKKEICGSLLLIIDMFLIFILYKDIFNITKRNYYNSALDKILKDYGDVIIEVISEVKSEDFQVIEVKNFNEMLDLEEELKIPIIFYEIIKDELGEFTLTHNNMLYRFILENKEEFYEK